MCATIPDLGDFGLSYALLRFLGWWQTLVASREVYEPRNLLREVPGSSGNFGLADIARGGAAFHLRY